jgi:hypothetical protein
MRLLRTQHRVHRHPAPPARRCHRSHRRPGQALRRSGRRRRRHRLTAPNRLQRPGSISPRARRPTPASGGSYQHSPVSLL